ncbi:DNA-binding helix-turn-helix protein [Neorhizobium galegae bv. officinalis]|nr:DNA-binding helix-turn-helix protein [Neorhizobium galegae bv. officinalis]
MHRIQFITSPNGDEMVVLPKSDYEAMMAALSEANEDDEDVAIYDARKADLENSNPLPAEVSAALLAGDNRLKAIRKFRGMSQQRLAALASLAQGFLSDLESGRRNLTDAVAENLASALDVPAEWLKN